MTEEKAPDFRSFADYASSTVAKLVPEANTGANKMAVAINRVSQLLTYDFDSTIHRPEGSSWAAYRVIFAIWLAGPLSPARAAELTGMGKSAISNLLKPLVKQGYVVEQASAEDRRSKLLALSEAGNDYVFNVFRKQNEREAQWAETLTPIEQDLLISLLNKLLGGTRAEEVRQQRR